MGGSVAASARGRRGCMLNAEVQLLSPWVAEAHGLSGPFGLSTAASLEKCSDTFRAVGNRRNRQESAGIEQRRTQGLSGGTFLSAGICGKR